MGWSIKKMATVAGIGAASLLGVGALGLVANKFVQGKGLKGAAAKAAGQRLGRVGGRKRRTTRRTTRGRRPTTSRRAGRSTNRNGSGGMSAVKMAYLEGKLDALSGSSKR